MSLYICLTAGTGLIGKAIRKLTQSDVNHAFIAYKDPVWECWNATQIDQRGIIIVPAKTVEYQDIICFEHKDDLTFALPRIGEIVGSKYDYLGIFGFMCKLTYWRLFHKNIPNPVHKKGELFCSEAVTTFLQAAGIPWAMSMDPASTSPGDLLKKLDNDTTFETRPVPW